MFVKKWWVEDRSYFKSKGRSFATITTSNSTRAVQMWMQVASQLSSRICHDKMPYLSGKNYLLLSFVVSSVSLSLSHWYPGSGVVLDCIDSWSLHHYLLLLSELFCLCCVAALKSLPALSFNALIFPILRIVCTISFHYSCPWISSMSCTAFKITRWPIFIPRCITSAFYIPVDLY